MMMGLRGRGEERKSLRNHGKTICVRNTASEVLTVVGLISARTLSAFPGWTFSKKKMKKKMMIGLRGRRGREKRRRAVRNHCKTICVSNIASAVLIVVVLISAGTLSPSPGCTFSISAVMISRKVTKVKDAEGSIDAHALHSIHPYFYSCL